MAQAHHNTRAGRETDRAENEDMADFRAVPIVPPFGSDDRGGG
jgi:hypothetical protein